MEGKVDKVGETVLGRDVRLQFGEVSDTFHYGIESGRQLVVRKYILENC